MSNLPRQRIDKLLSNVPMSSKEKQTITGGAGQQVGRKSVYVFKPLSQEQMLSNVYAR